MRPDPTIDAADTLRAFRDTTAAVRRRRTSLRRRRRMRNQLDATADVIIDAPALRAEAIATLAVIADSAEEALHATASRGVTLTLLESDLVEASIRDDRSDFDALVERFAFAARPDCVALASTARTQRPGSVPGSWSRSLIDTVRRLDARPHYRPEVTVAVCAAAAAASPDPNTVTALTIDLSEIVDSLGAADDPAAATDVFAALAEDWSGTLVALAHSAAALTSAPPPDRPTPLHPT